MIELLDRPQIFKLNTTFASFIAEVQDVQYNPSLEHNRYEEGVYVEENEKSRFVSQEECDKWTQQALIEYNKRKCHIATVSIKDKYKGESVYQFPTADINHYAENLAKGIENLTASLSWKSAIFLLDYSIPWLHQDNDYDPVKKALEYLKSIGVTNTFVGGFKANGKDLIELAKHLFWIIRCNASLPTCYFSGLHQDVVASICKHGNIHVQLYSEQDKSAIEKAATKIGMVKLEDARCQENFSDTGAINGRQIIL
jgi:hypothetical protein